MKRAALAASAAAGALLVSLALTAASAAPPGGYTVSRVVLPTKAFGIAVDPVTGLVYVGGSGTALGGGRITVIDAASQAVEGSITVPVTPAYVAVDPVTDTVYASGANGGLTVIDGATDEVITTIPSAGGSVAVDPATDTVYADTRPGSSGTGIAVIDGATNSIMATIALASAGGTANLAADPSTDTVYASDNQNRTLYAIDGATDAVTKSLQLPGSWVTGLTVDSANGSVYAVDNGRNTVDVVSGTTLMVTASVTGCPYHVVAAAADPTANVIFVTSSASAYASPADSTCVINGATNALAETFPRGGTAVAADPVTGAAYIAGWNPSTDIWTATPSDANELSPMVFGFAPYEFGSPSATLAVGISSSFSLLLSALPAATVTETGALPAGITMSSSGVFSGTPAAGTVGTYPITVTASNGVDPVSTVPLTIMVDIAPAITSAASTTFRTGVHGSFTVQATGSPVPTVSAVDYASWMTFTQGSSSGVLAGTPPPGSGGLWTVYVSADNGYKSSATQTITITVDEPPGVVAASRLTFRAGHDVRYRIMSTGFPAAALRESGRLPRGLRFHIRRKGVAVIIGKPARSDKGKHFLITITANNHIGRTAIKKVTIWIR